MEPMEFGRVGAQDGVDCWIGGHSELSDPFEKFVARSLVDGQPKVTIETPC